MSLSNAKPDPKATADRLKKYFAALPPDTRRVMKSFRAAIKAAAPDVAMGTAKATTSQFVPADTQCRPSDGSVGIIICYHRKL